jgi:hypothetical protein
MRTSDPDIQRLQQDLETAFPDQIWLKLLELFLPSGVANTAHMGAGLGMNRDKLSRSLNKLDVTGSGFPPIIRLLDHPLKRPAGSPGKPPHVYLLDSSGADLLNANGHPGTRACALKTDREINHALSMLSVHMAAREAGLEVVTDALVPFGGQRSIRPDHRISLPDGRFVLYEIEQDTKRALIPRMLESLANKQAFFKSEAGQAYIPEVRMLVNLPRGTKLNQTLNVWQECFRLLAEQQKTGLAFRLLGMPLGEFLKQPDWDSEATDRWQELNALAETEEPGNDGQGVGPINPYEQNRSAARDNVLLKALLQEYNDHIVPHLPPADFGMFDVVYTIYSASNSDRSYSTDLPHESVYLLKRYLEMHPLLTERLRKILHQGKGHIRWNYITIVHRMQMIINCFLAYHGWQCGNSLKVKAVSEGWSGPGNFGVTVEKIELDFSDQHEFREYVIHRALAWVLWALFEYAEELGLGRPEFW